MRYDEKVKEEALTQYLGGHSYLKISRDLNEQYGYTLHASTIKRWADRNLWQDRLAETREAIGNVAQKKAIDSLTAHIDTLQVIQNQFLEKAGQGGIPVSTNDMINTIRLLMSLEHGDEMHKTLAKDVANEVRVVLIDVGIPKAQRNKVLQLLAQRLAIE